MDRNRLDKLKKSENGRRGFKEVSHLLYGRVHYKHTIPNTTSKSHPSLKRKATGIRFHIFQSKNQNREKSHNMDGIQWWKWVS